MRVMEKTIENSEWLVRKARQGMEPDTSSLTDFNAEPLRHWWGRYNKDLKLIRV